MLDVVTIETPGLGDRSYVVHDGEVALVVDPQRDIDRIVAAAHDAGVSITHVAETHIHNDYVTGGVQLAERTGAAYLVAAAEEVAYHRTPVHDGDEIGVGSLAVRVLHTPGHTQHHVAYLVLEAGEPAALFTGGSLLYGTVGRTDLVRPELTDELTRAQFRSVRRLVSELPDAVDVWPTHGFGSFCSSAAASGATRSSIGAERIANPASTAAEDAFVEQLLSGLTAYPAYYAHMGPINRAGPAALDLTPPARVDGDELRRRIRAGAWVVDVGRRRIFAGGHIAGTLSFEFGNSFATYVGWVVPWGTPITFVADSAREVAEAQRALARIGFDGIAGAATGPRAILAGGEPLASYPVASFADLARALGSGAPPTVLDVRRHDERIAGAIPGSVHVPLQELQDRQPELPDGPLWVHCASGFRASIASSLLHRAGRDVVHIDDEWAGAEAHGVPVHRSARTDRPGPRPAGPVRPPGNGRVEPGSGVPHAHAGVGRQRATSSPRDEITIAIPALTARGTDIVILDVRYPHEWEAGRIAGSVHIPLDELDERAGELDGSRPVVAVCRTGRRSAEATGLLRRRGFDAASLDGGMVAWAAAGLPVVGPDGAPGSVADSTPPNSLTPDLALARDSLIEVAYALQDRFGDREPTDDEARSFMLDWLVGKGTTRESAGALLDG